jgi:hypothetical protein
MKQIIRLTESDLHRIVKESVVRILKEDFNQFSDGDFASTGNPYDLDADPSPISEISHLTPKDLRRLYVWETGDSYYEFEATYGDSVYTMVSIRGYFNGDLNVEDVVLGGGGFGRQMNPRDVQSSEFEEWFNSTLGEHLAKALYKKIELGDFANDADSVY